MSLMTTVSSLLKGASVTLDDYQLGTLSFNGEYWTLEEHVDNHYVDVGLEGNRNGPYYYPRSLWLKISDHTDRLWADAKSYFVNQLIKEQKKPAMWQPSDAEFRLFSINVMQEQSFLGGDLLFHFELVNDPYANYVVVFRGEFPFAWHRDE